MHTGTAIFLLSLSSALAQPGQLPFGNFELNINARPSTPYPAIDNYNSALTENGIGQNYNITVSRHHIIPFNLLRSFYNRVAERNRLRNLSGFLNTYANNLYLYAGSNGIDCANLGDDLIDAGNLAQAQYYGLARPGGTGYALGFDTFEEFYTWLPGNLFVGPTNRSDDPQDGFESNAQVIVGAENFEILSRLFSNMNAYISNNDDSLLNSISADLSKIAQRQSVYTLNAQHWVFVNGSYKIRSSEQLLQTGSHVDSTINSGTCNNMKPNFGVVFLLTVESSD
jgi:hypothetical protein